MKGQRSQSLSQPENGWETSNGRETSNSRPAGRETWNSIWILGMAWRLGTAGRLQTAGRLGMVQWPGDFKRQPGCRKTRTWSGGETWNCTGRLGICSGKGPNSIRSCCPAHMQQCVDDCFFRHCDTMFHNVSQYCLVIVKHCGPNRSWAEWRAVQPETGVAASTLQVFRRLQTSCVRTGVERHSPCLSAGGCH